MPTDLRNPDPSFVSLLTVCCLVTFGCYLAVSLRLPVVPLYARGFGVTTAQIGAINAAFYLMAGLLSVPSGALSDLFGRKKLCIAGSAILCIYFGLMAGSIGLGPVIEAMGFSAGFLITAALNLPFVAVFAWSMRGEEDGKA